MSRDRILEAATRLMAARGYEATSLGAIAAEVGVQKPSLLYHFESKASLRQAVLDLLLARWNESLPRILMATTHDGIERFDAVMAEVSAFFLADTDRARLLLRELLDRPADLRDSLDRLVRPWLGVVASYIRKGQRSGEVYADVDPDSYVLSVVTMFLGALAALPTISPLIEGPGDTRGNVAARYLDEVIRTAKRALFRTPVADAPPREA
jgi:TetR/AcrR family transcriptional regulator